MSVRRAMNENGVPCPSCGGVWSFVTDSRPGGSDYWRRRRTCKSCGERFTTQEVVVATRRGGKYAKRFDPKPVRSALERALRLLPPTEPAPSSSEQGSKSETT